MHSFEQEFGADRELAEKWLKDPYKAPEQRAWAQDYIDHLDGKTE